MAIDNELRISTGIKGKNIHWIPRHWLAGAELIHFPVIRQLIIRDAISHTHS